MTWVIDLSDRDDNR